MRAVFIPKFVQGSVSAILLAGAISPSFAQSTPPVDPSPTQSLLTSCSAIGKEEQKGDKTHSGQCVAQTGDWVATLAPIGTNDAARDQAVADLVVQLSSLVTPEDGCTAYNSEIAGAIDRAGEAISDHGQQVRVQQIAYTVGHCQPQVQTADIHTQSISTPQ